MRRIVHIGVALVTFGVALLVSVHAHAGSDYWNNSGYSISHQYYPGRRSSFSYYDYSPSYYGFNRYYRFESSGPRRGSEAEHEARTPISSDAGPGSALPHASTCRQTGEDDLFALERFRAGWIPFRLKKKRQNNNLESRF